MESDKLSKTGEVGERVRTQSGKCTREASPEFSLVEGPFVLFGFDSRTDPRRPGVNARLCSHILCPLSVS